MGISEFFMSDAICQTFEELIDAYKRVRDDYDDDDPYMKGLMNLIN